jgi:hypothetical protein
MTWLTWLGARKRTADPAVAAWHRAWSAAAESPAAADVERLRAALESLPGTDDDREVEREMLEGLEQLEHLISSVPVSGLPVIETGHRAAGRDPCHFAAPVTLDSEGGGLSGTLLLTAARAVFVGGARTVGMAWHALACTRDRRDLILTRRSDGLVHRLRCNTYGDALRAAFLARRLGSQPRV